MSPELFLLKAWLRVVSRRLGALLGCRLAPRLLTQAGQVDTASLSLTEALPQESQLFAARDAYWSIACDGCCLLSLDAVAVVGASCAPASVKPAPVAIHWVCLSLHRLQ